MLVKQVNLETNFYLILNLLIKLYPLNSSLLSFVFCNYFYHHFFFLIWRLMVINYLNQICLRLTILNIQATCSKHCSLLRQKMKTLLHQTLIFRLFFPMNTLIYEDETIHRTYYQFESNIGL